MKKRAQALAFLEGVFCRDGVLGQFAFHRGEGGPGAAWAGRSIWHGSRIDSEPTQRHSHTNYMNVVPGSLGENLHFLFCLGD